MKHVRLRIFGTLGTLIVGGFLTIAALIAPNWTAAGSLAAIAVIMGCMIGVIAVIWYDDWS